MHFLYKARVLVFLYKTIKSICKHFQSYKVSFLDLVIALSTQSASGLDDVRHADNEPVHDSLCHCCELFERFFTKC